MEVLREGESFTRTKKEKEQEEQAFEKLLADQSPEQQDKSRYQDRINTLFEDFNKSLSKDFLTYDTQNLQNF